MTVQTSTDTYAFDNEDPEAADRHRHLAGILDAFTCARLSRLGTLTGWRCLELGAGGGSVAAWLVGQVGPTGRVTATDVNVRHLPADAGYEVLQHDLDTDPVPTGPWDLIHARLVLVHLPRRREILRRLADSLASGGALAIEEWDSTLGAPLLASSDRATTSLYEAYHQAIRQVLSGSGADPQWANQVHGAMIEDGLVDVDTELHARSWPGGTAGMLLNAVNLGQVRAELLNAGFTEAQMDQLRQAVHDPRNVVRGLVTYSTLGRRPADCDNNS